MVFDLRFRRPADSNSFVINNFCRASVHYKQIFKCKKLQITAQPSNFICGNTHPKRSMQCRLRCGQNHLLNYKQKKPLSGNYVYFVSKAQRVNKLSSRRAHVGGDNSSLHICFKILGTIAFCLYLDRETCAL